MVFRRLYKVGTRVVCAHVIAQGVLVGHAALGRDPTFEQRWRGAHHVAMRSGGMFSRTRTLAPDEVECVNAWLDLLRFVAEPTGNMRLFSAQCTLNDQLIFFDGRSEIADGFAFMSYFFERTDPVVTAIRREETSKGPALHIRTQTEAKVRWLPIQYTFTSAATLSLEDQGGWRHALATAASSGSQSEVAAAVLESSGGATLQRRKRIASVEHRWFGGPIVSRFTGTYKNAYGDVGDLLRRWEGFVLATAVTNSEYLM
jgi:hypothetical protein